tara:strand:+ start:16 stop:486 length:471 start_codon:yes stop_codon:yes gene_type:complete
MDNNNDNETSTNVETNNNEWKLVKPSRDDIFTLKEMLESLEEIDIKEAKDAFLDAFDCAQMEYNRVVDEANDKLEEIRELIEDSDWGKSLINYEDEEIEKNQPLHQLLHGLTGIDDFLSDVDRHDECLEFYNNGHEGNSDGIDAVIEDLEALVEIG